MRRIALLLCLWCGAAGLAQAQGQTTVPIESLEAAMVDLRAQTVELARLIVGQRLAEPGHLHDLARILADLATIMNRVATHAEHAQITTTQRQALQTEIDRTRLMLQQLNTQIGVVP